MDILLIGGNGFGKVHAETYKRLGYDFSVYDRNESILREYKDKYGVKRTYSDLNEAINSTEDIVDIVLPHTMHHEFAIKAMKLKKNVLLEKPISVSLEEANDMIEVSRKYGVKFMVAEQFYFDTSLNETLRAIQEGVIGKAHTIIVRSQQLFDNHGWRDDEGQMGGGALIDGGIHFLELLLDIGGGYGEIKSYTYRGSDIIGGEDSTIALFQFEKDCYGMFYYSWSYDFAPSLPSYEVIGTKGSIVEQKINGKEPEFTDIRTRKVLNPPLINGIPLKTRIDDVYEKEIGSFLDSVQNDLPVPYPNQNALRNLKAILEIYGRN
jgi:predicted dehydrogenase